MKRVVHHILLGLLVFGLLGPMTARAWGVAVRTGMFEEEHETHKNLAVFRSTPRFMARGTVPYRPTRHQWRVRRPVLRVPPPAQTLRPRVAVVWHPLLLGPDGDDPHH